MCHRKSSAHRQRRRNTMSVWEILTSFEGRIPRRIFWIAFLSLQLPLGLAAGIIDICMGYEDPDFLGPATVIVALVLLLPMTAVYVKRLHDRNKSGWFVLINLVPAIGPIWFFIEIGLLPSTYGPNVYGEDPLDV
jgi:uncharacterized membrane protein YhaH (DUF805 family)